MQRHACTMTTSACVMPVSHAHLDDSIPHVCQGDLAITVYIQRLEGLRNLLRWHEELQIHRHNEVPAGRQATCDLSHKSQWQCPCAHCLLCSGKDRKALYTLCRLKVLVRRQLGKWLPTTQCKEQVTGLTKVSSWSNLLQFLHSDASAKHNLREGAHTCQSWGARSRRGRRPACAPPSCC